MKNPELVNGYLVSGLQLFSSDTQQSFSLRVTRFLVFGLVFNNLFFILPLSILLVSRLFFTQSMILYFMYLSDASLKISVCVRL